MTKSQITRKRQNALFQVLKQQGLGVINITDHTLSALVGCSRSTIARDLEALDNNEIIIRETRLITVDGKTRNQRDIIIPGETPRRFTLAQHSQLSNAKNHKVTTEGTEPVWYRRIDGQWERSMLDKQFKSETEIWRWIYPTMANHRTISVRGERFKSRKS